jgi:acetylornithine deacetylase/succinyl-diaminopimelate desuccinylase-like protein
MAKIARFLKRLDGSRLPVHITEPTRLMFGRMAEALPFPTNLVVGQLLNPALTDSVLNLLGAQGRVFDPLLHNTVNATIVRGGDKVNVIPSEIVVELDGRLLPGFTPDTMLSELRALVGPDVEFEVVRHDPGPAAPDLSLFDMLSNVLRQADSSAVPVPLVLGGVTDGRFFSRLGIQTYGFLPMQLPPDINFSAVIHAADERVPVDSIAFGANAIYQAIQQQRS